MARKRRIFRAELKAKVALEAVKGLRTVSEIAQKHKLHATQINLWKKQLVEGAVVLFEDGRKKSKEKENDEPESAELYEQIGRLKVELEWLKKKVAEDRE
jgi:transposase